jgi:NADP-reducing hydrogenase subunit HndD
MNTISIKINGKDVAVEAGKSILDAAKENGINIPTLCFHPDVETRHHCGMCIVEVKDKDGFQYACTSAAEEGMVITTQSEIIKEERKKNLDKVLAKHLLECDDCVWYQHCKLLDLVKEFEAKPVAVPDENNQVLQVGSIVFDQTKCFGCENCVNVCPTNFLDMDARDKVSCSPDGKKDCINCGQCIIHCPVGAIEGAGEFEELEKVLKDPSKTVVVQFAPALRTSIGEEFGMQGGEIATGQLTAGHDDGRIR